jgi:hypothetical protein
LMFIPTNMAVSWVTPMTHPRLSQGLHKRRRATGLAKHGGFHPVTDDSSPRTWDFR